jgi:peptide/nickel transport system substrate-binding protein
LGKGGKMMIYEKIDDLQALLGKGEISRRDFLKKIAALGLTASIATMLPVEKLMAATPKRGGIFRIGVSDASTSDTLNPELNVGTGMLTTITFAMHNYLAETGPGGELIPQLATSWESSPDAKVWTFHLRRGVEFQNGKTVTASDVVASINIHRGEKTKSSAKPLLKEIDDVIKDGEDKVIVRLKSGNADMPYLFSDFRLAVLPAKDEGVNWQSNIGAGAYILKEFEPGVRAYLERNPNYWRTDRAFFDQVKITAIVDPSARTTAIVTGAVDAIDKIDFKIADMLKKKKNIVVEETTGGLHYTFPMMTDVAPFSDNNVRTAIKLAVDREALLKTFLRGHGIVGNDHPISPNYRFHNIELPQRTYDPEKAKYYLKKAGMSTLSVDLSAADAAFTGAVDAATLYKEYAAKADINIKVIREPNDGYWSNVWLKKPWVACFWGGTATEDICFSQAYAAEASWNDTHWKDPRFNKLLVEARAELNMDKRREMYGEMQRILSDEGGLVLPLFPNNIFATSDKIVHGKLEERWPMDGRRACERWWFA